jgi:hypothetical protein
MKLSRIDLIGQNGNDGLHYAEEVIMSMTRKDFEAIAEIIRKANLLPKEIGLKDIAQELSSYFKHANPSFDKHKFMRACGWYQE